ncbi:MAG: hypothetical protein AB8G05_21265 [Oligoflexales bacterium]
MKNFLNWNLSIFLLVQAGQVIKAACNPHHQDCRIEYTLSQKNILAYTSHLPGANLGSVKRMIVGIHGYGRDAEGLYQALYRASEVSGHLNETLILVPYFQAEEMDIASDSKIPFNPDYWTWTKTSWIQGDDSLGPGVQISSFSMVDLLISHVLDRNRLPVVQSTVIAGHSAGGQFTQRYAIFSDIEKKFPWCQFTYVVANPSNYLYLDERRPDWAGFFPGGGAYISQELDGLGLEKPSYIDPYVRLMKPFQLKPEFVSTSSGLHSSGTESCLCKGGEPCPYERYKYGFAFKTEESNHYACVNGSNQNCSGKIPNRLQQDVAKTFLTRKVIYLLGEYDNAFDSPKESGRHNLGTSCAANFQGPDRLTRGMYYFEYLKSFGNHNHQLVYIPQAGHGYWDIFRHSERGRKALFGGELPKEERLAPAFKIYSLDEPGVCIIGNESTLDLGYDGYSTCKFSWILQKIENRGYYVIAKNSMSYLKVSAEGQNSPLRIEEYGHIDHNIWELMPNSLLFQHFYIKNKGTGEYLYLDIVGRTASVKLTHARERASLWKMVGA